MSTLERQPAIGSCFKLKNNNVFIVFVNGVLSCSEMGTDNALIQKIVLLHPHGGAHRYHGTVAIS